MACAHVVGNEVATCPIVTLCKITMKWSDFCSQGAEYGGEGSDSHLQCHVSLLQMCLQF